MTRLMALVLGALLLLLASCSTGSLPGDMLLYGPLGGATIYGNAQYLKQVEAGTAPPLAVTRHCNQEGLVRGSDGRWQQDGPLTTACLTEAGWRMTPQGLWERL
jgi:hypothetical protein